MIEILITLLVLAVGLLGLAALQGVSLQTGQVAYQQTQAVNIASAVADFARANRSRADNWIKTESEALAQELATQRLSNGSATVAVGTDNQITITINWTESRLEDLEGSPEQTMELETRI